MDLPLPLRPQLHGIKIHPALVVTLLYVDFLHSKKQTNKQTQKHVRHSDTTALMVFAPVVICASIFS